MGLFDKLLGKKPTTSTEPQPEQAILIYVQGSGLEPSVYEECDTSTLEDLLTAALGNSGEVDGNETGPTETTLFLYGKDSEAMFLLIEPVLTSYPLCKNSRVIIRQGKPGSLQREIKL